MLILSYGIPKSGSTLAYELIGGILHASGRRQEMVWNDTSLPKTPRPDFTRNFVSNIDRDKLVRLLTVIGDRDIVVKTHSNLPQPLIEWVEELQSERRLQVIASYRDPRDLCLAAMDAGEKRKRRGGRKGLTKADGLDRIADLVNKRIRRFRKWGSIRGALRLDYDELAFEPHKAIDKIERCLGIKCDREQALRYAFEEARTLKNKAKRHRYEDELDGNQKNKLYEAFRDFIENVCEVNNDAWFGEVRERKRRAKENTLGAPVLDL